MGKFRTLIIPSASASARQFLGQELVTKRFAMATLSHSAMTVPLQLSEVT